MAQVKILYRNRGLAGTWSATTAVATLPVSNLANPKRGTKYRSTSIAAQRIVVDLGAAYAIDAVALATHNLTSAATITIKGHTADTWAAPAFSTTLTGWDDKDSGVLVKILASTQTYRYWAFEPTDAGNTDGYLEFGVIALGPLFAFSDAPAEVAVKFVDPSITTYAPSQTPHTEERNVYLELELDWRLMTEAVVFGTLQTALREIGTKRDGALSIFSEAPGAGDVSKTLNVYGRFVDLPPFVMVPTTNGNRYNWAATFRESL